MECMVIILAVSMIIVFLDIEDAHNSMSDVKATLKCFKEMKKLGWIQVRIYTTNHFYQDSSENPSTSSAIFEENIPSITQDTDKTLWKNHKISDFFPEFCQKMIIFAA